jgi:hypothetical protein
MIHGFRFFSMFLTPDIAYAWPLGICPFFQLLEYGIKSHDKKFSRALSCPGSAGLLPAQRFQQRPGPGSGSPLV